MYWADVIYKGGKCILDMCISLAIEWLVSTIHWFNTGGALILVPLGTSLNQLFFAIGMMESY